MRLEHKTVADMLEILDDCASFRYHVDPACGDADFSVMALELQALLRDLDSATNFQLK